MIAEQVATARGSPPDRTQIFVSYSHEDAKWLDRLQKILTPLKRSRAVNVWADTRIRPGERWRRELETALRSAKVAVLLVSPDFLASQFIADNELPALLDAASNDGVRVLWVCVRACLYDETPIVEYQAAHDVSRPLDELPCAQRYRVLTGIAKAIRDAIS